MVLKTSGLVMTLERTWPDLVEALGARLPEDEGGGQRPGATTSHTRRPSERDGEGGRSGIHGRRSDHDTTGVRVYSGCPCCVP